MRPDNREREMRDVESNLPRELEATNPVGCREKINHCLLCGDDG